MMLRPDSTFFSHEPSGGVKCGITPCSKNDSSRSGGQCLATCSAAHTIRSCSGSWMRFLDMGEHLAELFAGARDARPRW